MKQLTPLGQYIDALCRNQNLSYREASRRAGLDETTVSQILRRGKAGTPRPDTLRMIADGLGGSYERMMQLAGHLPAPSEDYSVNLGRDATYKLQRFLERLAALPYERQNTIMGTALMLLDIDDAAQAQDVLSESTTLDTRHD